MQCLLAVVLGSPGKAAVEAERRCCLGEIVSLLDETFPEVFITSGFFSYLSTFPTDKLELNVTSYLQLTLLIHCFSLSPDHRSSKVRSMSLSKNIYLVLELETPRLRKLQEKYLV